MTRAPFRVPASAVHRYLVKHPAPRLGLDVSHLDLPKEPIYQRALANGGVHTRFSDGTYSLERPEAKPVQGRIGGIFRRLDPQRPGVLTDIVPLRVARWRRHATDATELLSAYDAMAAAFIAQAALAGGEVQNYDPAILVEKTLNNPNADEAAEFALESVALSDKLILAVESERNSVVEEEDNGRWHVLLSGDSSWLARAQSRVYANFGAEALADFKNDLLKTAAAYADIIKKQIFDPQDGSGALCLEFTLPEEMKRVFEAVILMFRGFPMEADTLDRESLIDLRFIIRKGAEPEARGILRGLLNELEPEQRRVPDPLARPVDLSRSSRFSLNGADVLEAEFERLLTEAREHVKDGDGARALQSFQEAAGFAFTSRRPHWEATARFEAAQVYESADMPQEALAGFDHVIRIARKAGIDDVLTAARERRCHMLSWLGEPEQAVLEANEILARSFLSDMTRARLHHLLSQAQEDVTQALASAETAYRIHAKGQDAHDRTLVERTYLFRLAYDVAQLAIQAGSLDKAEQFLRLALQHIEPWERMTEEKAYSSRLSLHYTLASIAASRGRRAQAATCCREALRLAKEWKNFKEQLNALQQLAHLYGDEPAQALPFLLEAKALIAMEEARDPEPNEEREGEKVNVLIQISAAYANMNMPAKGLASLREAERVNDDGFQNPNRGSVIHFNLAYHLWNQNQNVEEVIGHLREGLKYVDGLEAEAAELAELTAILVAEMEDLAVDVPKDIREFARKHAEPEAESEPDSEDNDFDA